MTSMTMVKTKPGARGAGVGAGVTVRRRIAAMALAGATAVAGMAGLSGVAGATTTHAGASITLHTAEKGPVGNCTLTAVAKGTPESSNPGKLYGITAGHCVDTKILGGKPVKITDKTGAVLADADELAQMTSMAQGVNSVGAIFNPANVNDYAIFPLDPSVTDTGMISSQIVTGVPQADAQLAQFASWFSPALAYGGIIDVNDLYPGQAVCKDGQTTGRTCGVILKVNKQTKEISAFIPAAQGDSGSPLHVRGADGKAYIVGGLSGGSPLLFNVFDGTYQHLLASNVR